MNKKIYHVEIEWSGYCRGTAVWEIAAENEDEAKENWCEGIEMDRELVREDIENEIVYVELLEDIEE
jgi:hypothetical protein